MIPGDYCRCVGENCERKETCKRYIAWRDKLGPRIVPCAMCLCQWDARGKLFNDMYIEVKKT